MIVVHPPSLVLRTFAQLDDHAWLAPHLIESSRSCTPESADSSLRLNDRPKPDHLELCLVSKEPRVGQPLSSAASPLGVFVLMTAAEALVCRTPVPVLGRARSPSLPTGRSIMGKRAQVSIASSDLFWRKAIFFFWAGGRLIGARLTPVVRKAQAHSHVTTPIFPVKRSTNNPNDALRLGAGAVVVSRARDAASAAGGGDACAEDRACARCGEDRSHCSDEHAGGATMLARRAGGDGYGLHSGRGDDPRPR